MWERLTRIERAFSAWKADVLPLHHSRVMCEQSAEGEGFEPSRAPSQHPTRLAGKRLQPDSATPPTKLPGPYPWSSPDYLPPTFRYAYAAAMLVRVYGWGPVASGCGEGGI